MNYIPISLLGNIDEFPEGLMNKRFLAKIELIFSPQFGFQQRYSTTHALIHLKNETRHKNYKGNYACGVFLDLQKTTDIVDHYILLKKLE